MALSNLGELDLKLRREKRRYVLDLAYPASKIMLDMLDRYVRLCPFFRRGYVEHKLDDMEESGHAPNHDASFLLLPSS